MVLAIFGLRPFPDKMMFRQIFKGLVMQISVFDVSPCFVLQQQEESLVLRVSKRNLLVEPRLNPKFR